MNALKFGFFALDPLLPGESEREFAEFRMGWADSLRPADHAEQALVNRIADSAWRLRRFPAVEASWFTAELLSEQASLAKREAERMLHHGLEPLASETQDPERFLALQTREREIRELLNSPQYALGRAFRRDSRKAGGFTRLSRCETLLERGFYRCLLELQRLQATRRVTSTKSQNEPTSLPTEVADGDAHGSPPQAFSLDDPE